MSLGKLGKEVYSQETGKWILLDGVNIYIYKNNAILFPGENEIIGFPSLFLQFYITIDNKKYPISGVEW